MITAFAAQNRPHPIRTLLVGASLLAVSSCAALTPATDADQSSIGGEDTTKATTATSASSSMTTTTASLPDPVWQELRLQLTPIAQLDEPIAATARSGSLNYYIAERAGLVRVVERTVNPRGKESLKVLRQPLLDISSEVSTDSERGLLDLAFTSDGRKLYVSYTDLDGTLIIAEYPVSRSDRADVDGRRELLRVPQPAGNHNGGSLERGADGFLYVGLGDGGGSGDPDGNGQNTQTLLGSIIRIDPIADGDRPYSIPDGNPFADGGGGLPEIWLWGVRNPWRISFDAQTGDLWVADVGQNEVEELDLFRAADGGGRGANLGWRAMEGDRPFENGSPPAGYTPPLFTYEHSDGRCSVTGGYVYRGQLLTLLQGVYVFGDYCSGEIFGLEVQDEGVLTRPLTVRSTPGALASFGEGSEGELLVLERTGPDGLGHVYRIDPKVVETDR